MISHALKIDSGHKIEWSRSGPQAFLNTTNGVLTLESSINRPDFGIVSSLYNGFSNSSIYRSEAASFQCTTGNCTWAPFVSAAVCSRCEDVSGDLKSTPGYGRDGSNVPNQGNIMMTGNYTTYSLPYANIKNFHSPFPKYTGDWWSYTTYGGSSPARTLMTANTTYDPRATLKFQRMETLLMAYLIIRASDDWLNLKAAWNQSRPTATECALYLCANEYETRSQGNALQDNITGSWAIRDPLSYQLSTSLDTQDLIPAKAWDEEQGAKLYEPIISLGKHDLRLIIPDETIGSQASSRTVNVT